MGRKASKYILFLLFLFVFVAPAVAQESMTMTASAETEAPDDLYYDAVKAAMLGNDKNAQYLFTEFLKVKPQEAAPYFELAKLAMKRNKADSAEYYMKKAVTLDTANIWYKEVLASVLADRSKYEEAATLYNQIAEKKDRNSDYLTAAAMQYQRAGKYEEALNLLNKAIGKTGPDEDLLIHKEQIFVKMNKLDSTAKIIRQLISLDPTQGKYYILLGELYDNNKEHDKAMKLYQQALQSLPNDPSIQLGLAQHYIRIKDTVHYEEYVKKAITNSGLDAETQLGILLPYLQSLGNDESKKKEGLSLVEQLVAQHKDNAQVLAMYGEILVLNNNYEKAAVQYKKSIALDPSRFYLWQRLLSLYADKKGADSLIYYGQKAMRLFPNQAMVHYLYGVGLMNKGSYPEAINAINRAIDLQPEDDTSMLVQMYSVLGDIYNTTKQPVLSDSVFEHVLRITPNNAMVLNNYAYYLSERNVRLTDAEKMSARSLQLQPGTSTYMDTYGWILYKEGQYNKAKEYIQKAIDMDGANADAALYEHLGAVYYKLNEIDKAVQLWQKAKEKGSENPQIDKQIQERKLYE
ncbi:MAG: tetratricopeptide repeat protein [Bacteroidetes bacterium]|nr:tetratricopeptide repeat protein [Bacteroidota bacterium]